MGKDYYNVLGVNKSASQDEIKKAFRKKAHQYHPDKSGGDEAKFKEINEAYQVLGNAEKRSQYDRFGSSFEQAQAGGGYSGFDGFRDFSGFAGGFSNGQGNINVDFDDLSDMFGGIGDIFGFSSGKRGGRRRGNDIQVSLTIEFMEAVKGVEREFNLRKKTQCDHCHGNLAEPGTKIETCSNCHGTGRVAKVQRTILGNMQVQGVCEACGGEGKTYAQKCKKCGGSGTILSEEKINLKIPAGINDGESIRLSGRGEAGERGAAAGDLYVKVNVRPDKKFVREGYDVKTKNYISFKQAVLGDKIEVDTVAGTVKLKIPSGTEAGTVFKLKGKGVTKLRGGGQGDHFVEIAITTPKSVNRKQKKLLEELGL